MSRGMTTEKYKEKIKEIYKGRYELLSECNSSTDEVLLLDTMCKNTFKKVANEFTRSRVVSRYLKFCPKCKPDRSRTLEDVQQELDKLTSNRITIVSKARNMHDQSKVQCNVCDHKWETPLHSMISNIKTNSTDSFGCPVCSQKRKKNTDIFKEEVDRKWGDIVTVTGEYVDTNTKIDVMCNICNKPYGAIPAKILYNDTHGCPECKKRSTESTAVRYIKNYLKGKNVNFIQEHSFVDCINVKELPFDFLIMINNKIKLIEYDGEQHFRGWNGRPDSLIKIQNNDNIKNTYCKDKNIPLLRLNYKQTNADIEKELENFLKI